MQRALLRSFVLAGVAASPAAQAVHVVDRGDGPGTDFVTIQAAIDAAGDGDLLVIRTGDYGEDLVIDGKTLILQEQPVSNVTVASISVRNLGASDYVMIYGLRAELFDAFQNQGPIWCELSSFANRLAEAEIRNCVSVVLKECEILAGEGPLDLGLHVAFSSVFLYDCRVSGRNGQSGDDCGTPGIRSVASGLYVEGSWVDGGDSFTQCGGCGAAGDAIDAVNSNVTVKDSLVRGGRALGAGCVDGEDFALDGSSLTMVPGLARRLVAPSPKFDYEPKPVTYLGMQGDRVLLQIAFRPRPGFVPFGFTDTYAHLRPATTLTIGPVPSVGIVEFPPIELSVASLTYFAQAFYLNGAEFGLTNPVQLHVRNGEPRGPRRSDRLEE